MTRDVLVGVVWLIVAFLNLAGVIAVWRLIRMARSGDK
jgi:hypothetical protein